MPSMKQWLCLLALALTLLEPGAAGAAGSAFGSSLARLHQKSHCPGAPRAQTGSHSASQTTSETARKQPPASAG